MICIPITAASNTDAIKEIKDASKFADIVELRIDYIETPDLNALLKEKIKPVIVTNRPKRAGGMFTGDETDRIELLKKAISLNADYIDIEYDSFNKIKDLKNTKLIVSHHDFNGTPNDVHKIHNNLINSNAHMVKLITYANNIMDNFSIFKLLEETDFPTIAFCMGELGRISRILSLIFGGKLTFASLASGKESAPGQLTIYELTEVYRVPQLNRDTKIFGLLGCPVGHSMGTYIHNAAFKEKNFNAVYVPFKVKEDELNSFMVSFKELGFGGLSVTIPHKESIIAFLDEIDPVAKKIGAVNTVINQGGKLSGCNTDCPAAIWALENIVSSLKQSRTIHSQKRTEETAGTKSPLSGQKAVIIGSGGAARAIAFGLKAKDADITIFNRTYERGLDISKEVDCNCIETFDDLKKEDIDILVNTTPIGMYPNIDETPIPDNDILKKGMLVFDIVYNPVKTKLLKDAEKRGCTILDGVEMFVGQAAMQFELFTGQKAPVELMEKIIKDRLAD